MAARDPETRRLIASMGGYARSAKVSDRTSLTAAATRAANERWDRMVPADVTDPETRRRMAEAHMRAHMTRMVLARRKAAALRAEADRIEAEAASD